MWSLREHQRAVNSAPPPRTPRRPRVRFSARPPTLPPPPIPPTSPPLSSSPHAHPAHIIRLDAAQNRTWHYWHVTVHGIGAGQIYGYRVHGPNDPGKGLRFDGDKLLVDPYALAVVNTENYQRAAALRPGDNAAQALKCVVIDTRQYDWEGDAPLERPFPDAVIYEMHVAGFTRNPNSGLPVHLRGTYAGLIAKIPYLKELGILTVELMPVQQFDEQAAPNGVNYWGYQPVAWFAPHRQYSSQRCVVAAVDEFRDMVKALHRAGIDVILDVVFNHTAEDDEHGSTSRCAAWITQRITFSTPRTQPSTSTIPVVAIRSTATRRSSGG